MSYIDGDSGILAPLLRLWRILYVLVASHIPGMSVEWTYPEPEDDE